MNLVRIMYGGWPLTFFYLVLYITGLRPCSAQTTNIDEILPMLGPRSKVDVVALLDRSQGVGKHNFYYWVQPFFRSLLLQYASVHPEFARTAVVTFAKDATMDYDTISERDSGVTQCELFASPSALWDRVVFNSDPSVFVGTNLSGAMQHAVNILQRGRANRPNVTQVVIIVSDGDLADTEDPVEQEELLKSLQVNIFTVGIGSWLKTRIMRNLATKPGYYGNKRQWDELLNTNLTTLRPGIAPLLAELDTSFCQKQHVSSACEPGSRCYCDVDSANVKCLCPPGYHLHTINASTSCQPCSRDSFKEVPGSGPCIECRSDRLTSQNASTSRHDCQCLNNSCTPDPCESISCPVGQHCVALDDFNTTCQSDCPYSNCTETTNVPSVTACQTNPCHNEGKCYPDVNGESACRCPFNFRGRFCESSLDMCTEFRPCAENVSHCISKPASFKCICDYGYHGEFCQDVDPEPPFTGTTTTTDNVTAVINITTVAMTTVAVATTSSFPVVVDIETSVTSLYTTSNSSNSSIITGETSGELSDSELAAVIVCTLIAFFIIIAIIVLIIILIRRRRQKQAAAAAAAQQVVGPETKAPQPTHNGTWSRNFHGLWKNQTWRGAPEEDERTLTDGADVNRVPPKTAGRRRQNGYYKQNYLSEEITLKNEQLQTGRSMEDWRRYLVQLETAGIIFGGAIVRPSSSGSGYVKTNGWTFDVAELAAIRKEMNESVKPSTTQETRFIDVQGEQFTLRPAGDGSPGKSSLTGICKAARTSMAAALAVDNSLVVAIGPLSPGDMVSARCVREVQWIADMCGPK